MQIGETDPPGEQEDEATHPDQLTRQTASAIEKIRAEFASLLANIRHDRETEEDDKPEPRS